MFKLLNLDERMKFENNKWVIIEQSDYCKIPILEAQVFSYIFIN